MAALIRGPFAEALEADRDRLNALFAQARRASPNLDPGAFGSFLAESVAPAVDQLSTVAPDRLRVVVDELYGLALELVSKEFPARHPELVQGWGQLLAGMPYHLARAPRLLAGSVTNALYHLETTPGARPREWIESLLRLASLEPDVPTLLEAGKVVAWRAGLSQFRMSALETCVKLPRPLAYGSLGLLPEADQIGLETLVHRLRSDPWLSPTAISNGQTPLPELRLMARVGAFRGFGGPFLQPPRLTFSGGQLFASDGEACWAIHADIFGATLHRTGARAPRAEGRGNGGLRLERDGMVRCGPHARLFPELSKSTDSVSHGATLAVTTSNSHAVLLVALTNGAT